MSFNVRERFRERKFSYILKKRIKKDINDEFNNNKYKSNKNKSLKFFAYLSFFIIGFIKKFFNYLFEEKNNSTMDNNFYTNSSLITDKTINNSSNKRIFSFSLNKFIYKDKRQSKDSFILNVKHSNNANLSINSIQNKFNDNKKKKGIKNNIIENSNNKFCDSTTANKEVVYLENKIFCKFKRLLEKLDKTFIDVENEVYLINKYSNDEELLAEATIIRDTIQKLIVKLNQIKNEYDIIVDGKFIEEPLSLEDFLLIDDIIKYREIINCCDQNLIYEKLKLLDEYNHLFSNLEDVKGKVISIKNIKDERVNELSQRDKHFNITNVKINNLDEINKNCNFIINKHNKYLLDISDKVNRMNEKKIVSYKLKGLGDLISSSLKYIGLISLTPFSGVIPGIAVKTAITRRLVSEMIKNIHYEKNERIIYCVHNYISELDGKIYDINSVSKNIDDALNDIEKLKKEFRDYYFKYHLKEYEEVYKKIIKIEEDIIISKKNITTIRNSLLENKGLNQKVLKKVKRLNERNN